MANTKQEIVQEMQNLPRLGTPSPDEIALLKQHREASSYDRFGARVARQTDLHELSTEEHVIPSEVALQAGRSVVEQQMHEAQAARESINRAA